MVQGHGQRVFFHYSAFPLSVRVLFTGTIIILGIAYLFAMLHIYNSHAGRDGQPGISVQDIQIAYSGSKEDSRLEAALRGPMSGMVPAEEKSLIIRWVRGGADKQEYEATLEPLLQQRCLACHDGSNPHIPRLDTYDEVAEFAELDTGMDIFTLVRVSHIHMFGMTFIFFIVGYIFSHAYVRPLWFKSAVIAGPFVAILLDVGSWYLTKLFDIFAWVVLLGGGLMGLCFAIMCFVSLYQMWISRESPEPARRQATVA